MQKQYNFDWITDEARQILANSYLLEGETPYDMYDRISRTASNYLEKTPVGWCAYDAFMTMFSNGWFSPASPVAANLGTDRGLPVSCFGMQVPNSIDGIFTSAHEAAMLSKYGGGLGVDLSRIEGITPASTWAKLFDYTAASVSQGGVRRGAVAVYIDLDHPDAMGLLQAKDLLQGDPRHKLDCNIAVNVSDAFMAKLGENEKTAVELFAKVLSLRMKYGSPYLFFTGNANRQRGKAYDRRAMTIKHSQLCNEIALFSDERHTYNCVLSSFNLAKWREYEDYIMYGYHPFAWGIFFLDAVQQEFIDKAKDLPGLERAWAGAVKGRPLGLGTMGLHRLFQQEQVCYGDLKALALDGLIHYQLAKHSKQASEVLAYWFSEPEWCIGTGLRNTHTMAIAPTTTNSALCNAGTAGIEPAASNYYTVATAKGTFVRINPLLKELLTSEELKQVRIDNGSVKNIARLTEKQKKVFATFSELNQFDLLLHASVRQKAMASEGQAQGQSLNLYIDKTTPADEVARLHLEAYKAGLLGLYYVRSNSAMLDKPPTVRMQTRKDCVWCIKAKALLDSVGISYTEENKPEGQVPQIWYEGKQLPDGYNSLADLLGVSQSNTSNCSGCEG